MAQLKQTTEWWMEAAPDEVWEMLAHYERWPSWWKGIQSVELLERGQDDGVGSILRQRWRSRLPFTLVFDLEMTRVERPVLLDGRASGDLEGSCTWSMQQDAGGTRVRFSVDVRTARWWMSLPLPFAERVFRANFDTVMDWGREGLERGLRSRLDESTSGRDTERLSA